VRRQGRPPIKSAFFENLIRVADVIRTENCGAIRAADSDLGLVETAS
jgi:hypothetical protein